MEKGATITLGELEAVLYRRTSHDGWHTFGNQATYDHGHPARPLKRISA